MMPTGPEHHHRIALLKAGHLGALVAGGHHVGEQHGIVGVHTFGNHGWAEIGVGHAHVLSLLTVEATSGVGVAENAAHSRGFGVGLVAAAVEGPYLQK